jgi:hypothetical protein
MEIFAYALATFFSAQNEDGSWPLSRPLFHYPLVGNAYCFDYELLAQLLACRLLWEELLRHIPSLELATNFLVKTAYDLDTQNGVVAWASGHHPQLEGPESWSTASVYQFAFALDRLVAEAIRQALFEEVGAVYSSTPSNATKPPADDSVAEFAPKFLDATLSPPDAGPVSLRETLAKRFVFPIAREADRVGNGAGLDRETPMSAILFGPPGTSKTELAKVISEYLRWPLLAVDPSYLVKEGLDRVQAMANRLFSMLTMSEQVVILLDEFDELGRNRARNEELLSRFITTAMLPKLAAINKERRTVFLLATNYVRGFDSAFRRGGRFDMLLQVMPPNLDSKLNADEKFFPRWGSVLGAALEKLSGKSKTEAQQRIGELTFAEAERLVHELDGLTDLAQIEMAIEAAWKACTLERDYDTGGDSDQNDPAGSGSSHKKWREICVEEAKEIRLPWVRPGTAATK